MVKLYEGDISESTKKIMKEKHGIEMKHVEDHKCNKAKMAKIEISKKVMDKAVNVIKDHVSRNSLMLQAKEKGVKNFRILNKEELIKVLDPMTTDGQMQDIIKEAKRRWMAGWGSKAATAAAMLLMLCNVAFADTLKASWYDTASLIKEGTWKHSQGRMANGQLFKDDSYICASRLHKLGTMLRVTNTKNNKSVTVKVTDRIGKRFAATRIDLSKRAFMEIADYKSGIVEVQIEVLK